MATKETTATKQNGTSETLPAASASKKNLAKWLLILGEHYGKDISASNAAIYEAALGDLSPAELEMACKAALMECRFMPTVADIRTHIKRVAVVEQHSASDVEWADILDRAWAWDEYYENRPGGKAWGSVGRPQLSPAGEQAVRVCGGFTAIQRTAKEHLPLLKKQFDEAYHRSVEYGRNQLGAIPEKKLLDTVRALVHGQPINGIQ